MEVGAARKRGRPPKAAAVDMKAQLQAAALDLFARNGYAGTSIRAIAREVGVTDWRRMAAENTVDSPIRGTPEIEGSAGSAGGQSRSIRRKNKSDMSEEAAGASNSSRLFTCARVPDPDVAVVR